MHNDKEYQDGVAYRRFVKIFSYHIINALKRETKKQKREFRSARDLILRRGPFFELIASAVNYNSDLVYDRIIRKYNLLEDHYKFREFVAKVIERPMSINWRGKPWYRDALIYLQENVDRKYRKYWPPEPKAEDENKR